VRRHALTSERRFTHLTSRAQNRPTPRSARGRHGPSLAACAYARSRALQSRAKKRGAAKDMRADLKKQRKDEQVELRDKHGIGDTRAKFYIIESTRPPRDERRLSRKDFGKMAERKLRSIQHNSAGHVAIPNPNYKAKAGIPRFAVIRISGQERLTMIATCGSDDSKFARSVRATRRNSFIREYNVLSSFSQGLSIGKTARRSLYIHRINGW
jgi:hypothetical protein